MPFAGGHAGFDDTDSKPKNFRTAKKPSYNTYTRKRRGHKGKHQGGAHEMRPKSMNRVKGS